MLDSSKLKYMTDKTYVYDYFGKSKIELKGVEGGVTETLWKKKVLLSWLSPCEMAITFKDVVIDGSPPADKAAKFLSQYPLVVAVTDGRVQRVCTHPLDDAWAINMKKGVATAFQNSIPRLSPLSSGLNVTETDVVGKCPTKYEVEGEGENVVVKKNKDLRMCKNRFPTKSESPTSWLKTPVPIERHWSECKQEIKNGIYSKITCEDKSVIRPSVGAIRYIKGLQESTLQFVSESNEAPESLSTIHGEYGFESLLYSHKPLNKDQTKVPLLEAKLTEICHKTKESIEHEAASVMADIIQLLRHVPDTTVQQTLVKIRSGQYCPQKARLESLFLDAIAFTYDSGSVKTMVEELIQGRAKGSRIVLYAAALYLTSQPDLYAIEAVGELFKSNKNLPSVELAAATMVHKFCKHHHQQHHLQGCQRVPQVQAIIEHLNTRVQEKCKPCNDDETKEAAYATLEALGNIGVMTPEVTKTAMKCVETQGVDTNIHVAAIRSFRNAECQRYATMNLVNMVVDPHRDTEVRIVSYLTAIRCVEKADLEEIIYKISKENNTQVRSFVFSHMVNIQKSTSPGKAHLRYLLTNFVIPNDYGKDFRRHSRNIDLTFYAPSIQLGGGVESNIIYAPGSFVPRSVSFNFSSILYGQKINLGEIGTRLEGVDAFITRLFGPASPLHKHSWESMMNKVSDFIKEKGDSIIDHFSSNSRQRRSIDVNQVADLLKNIYTKGQPNVPRAEVYASIMGQDIAYKFFKGNLHNMDINHLVESYLSKFKMAASYLKNMQHDIARTSRISMDYRLATIQGTPLRIQFEGTAVVGMKLEGHLNLFEAINSQGGSENSLKVIPSLSVQANGFVGYECYLGKTGLRMNNTISSNSGITLSIKKMEKKEAEIHIDLPENMDLLNVESETYLMKAIKGRPEQIINPSGVHDVRVRQKSCISKLEHILGLRVCYDVDVLDLFRSTGLPLGPKSKVKVHLEKADHALSGYKVKANLENNQENKALKFGLETKGSSNPLKSEATLTYTNIQDGYKVKAVADTPGAKSKGWITFKNHEEYQELESVVEHESNEKTISKGFKYQWTTSSSGNARIHDFSLYASEDKSFPPPSKVLSFNIISRPVYRAANIAVILKTENIMREILALTLEAGFDLETPDNMRIPMLKKLRRMELYLASAGWKMNSYIRQERESQGDSVSTSALKIQHRNEEIFAYEATHTITRNSENEFNNKNDIKLKFGQTAYKIDQRTLNTYQKKGVILKVIPQSDGSYSFDFEATVSSSQEGHKALLLVDIPSWMRPIKFEGVLMSRGESGRYELDMFLKHGEQKAFELKGPTTLIISPALNKLETELEVKIMGHQLYKFNSHVEYSKQKLIMLFDLANERERVFLVEWKLGVRSIHDSHIVFRVDIAKFIKHRTDVMVKPGTIEIVLDNLILPNSSHQRRVKGTIDILYRELKSKIDFAWDADRDPSQHFTMESAVKMDPSQPGFCSIDSHLNYGGRTYDFVIDLNGDYFIHPNHGKNGFKFVLKNPERRSMVIELDSKINQQGPQIKLDFLTLYKNMEDREWKLTSGVELEKVRGTYNFQVNSDLRYVAPSHGESRAHMKIKRNANAEFSADYDVEVLVEVPGTSPVGFRYTLTATPIVWKSDLTLKSRESAKAFEYHVETFSHGLGLKTFDFKVDLDTWAHFLRNLRVLMVREGEGYQTTGSSEDAYGRGRNSYEENGRRRNSYVENDRRRPFQEEHGRREHSFEEEETDLSNEEAYQRRRLNQQKTLRRQSNEEEDTGMNSNEAYNRRRHSYEEEDKGRHSNEVNRRRRQSNEEGDNGMNSNEVNRRRRQSNEEGDNGMKSNEVNRRRRQSSEEGNNGMNSNELNRGRRQSNEEKDTGMNSNEAYNRRRHSYEEENKGRNSNEAHRRRGQSSEEGDNGMNSNEVNRRRRQSNEEGDNGRNSHEVNRRRRQSNEEGDNGRNSNEMNLRRRQSSEDEHTGMNSNEENRRRRPNRGGNEWRRHSSEENEGGMSSNEVNERRHQYHWRYHSPSISSRTLMFKTPDRTMECGCDFKPEGINAWYYPNKENSDAKYEIDFQANKKKDPLSSENQYEWKGRVSHPQFARDKEIILQLVNRGAIKMGTLEIDILPDTADKITASLASNQTTPNSVRIEAMLSAKFFKSHPKAIFTTAYSPHVLGFDFAYLTAPTSEPSFFMAGKYDNTTNRNAGVSFSVKNEGHTVIELSAIAKPELQQPECYGMKLKGAARAVNLGTYDIFGNLCRPAYIEFKTKKHGSSKIYTGRVGLQYPKTAEISLLVEEEGTQREQKVLVARAKLVSSTMLNLDLDYEPQEVDTIMNELSEKVSEAYSLVSSWAERIKDLLIEEAKSKGIDFPPKKLVEDMTVIQEEARRIYNSLNNKMHIMFEELRHIMHSRPVSYVIDVYYNVWSKMADIHRDFRVAMTWTLLHVMEDFGDIFVPIGQGLRELVSMMKDRHEPEFLRKLWQEFEESNIYRLILMALDNIHNHYPEQYEVLRSVWREIEDALLGDLEKLRLKLLAQPPVQRLIHWIVHEMKADNIAKLEAENIVSRILQEVVYVTVTKDTNRVQIQIPIRERLYSLTQVLQEATPYATNMVINIIWSFNRYITLPIQRIIQILYMPNPLHVAQYLPPFNGTAMVVGNSEVLTFDGRVLRIPQTPCRVRLATAGHTKLTFEHTTHDQQPRITLSHFTVKAVVNPDFTAKLNGQDVHDRTKMMGVEVKVNEREVKIMSPFLSVKVLKNSRVLLVEASGWAFGKTAGVLGTFDGEIENDMMMPTGARATNAQEFVTSWQEDTSCHTPEVTPAHIPFSRVVECQMLVGTRSRCNPIVDPEPFIRMCRQVHQACDAAKAYRDLCRRKGIKEPYPMPC